MIRSGQFMSWRENKDRSVRELYGLWRRRLEEGVLRSCGVNQSHNHAEVVFYSQRVFTASIADIFSLHHLHHNAPVSKRCAHTPSINLYIYTLNIYTSSTSTGINLSFKSIRSNISLFSTNTY